MTEFRVREAKIEDAAAIAEVRVAGWRFAYEGLIEQEVLDSLDAQADAQRYRERLTDLPEKQKWLVATNSTDPGAIAGFCTVGADRADKDRGEIYALYVSPRVVGLGAGYSLMESALEALRSLGFAAARLWVLAGNEHAVNFYRRQGWNLTGAEKVEKLSSGAELTELEMVRIL